MSGWLCDTQLISELMRKQPNPHVISWAEAQDGFYLSVITCEEIYAGLNQKRLEKKRT
jgi:predicted nucleic acid-binding protein